MTGSKKDHERAKSCHCNHISLKAWANIVLGTVDLVPSSTLDSTRTAVRSCCRTPDFGRQAGVI